MKNTLLTLIAVLFVSACTSQDGWQKLKKINESYKQHALLIESLVGTYDVSEGEEKSRLVLRKLKKSTLFADGAAEYFTNSKKISEHTWKITKEGELYIFREGGNISIFRINIDNSITSIARALPNGKKLVATKEQQRTTKKIN